MLENVTILRVGTDEAVRNVADLRENIKALKQELDNADASFEENARVTDELRKNQAALKDAMYATAQETADLTAKSDALYDENGKLNASYNTLVHTMAELKSAWRSTTDETERAQLGDRINRINSSLKEMDGTVGNYSRNVGDYANKMGVALEKAFRATAGSAANVINPLKNVKNGLTAISATPAVAILGLLAQAIQLVTKNLSSSEENANRMTRALSVFTPVADTLKNVVQSLGGAFAYLVEQITGLLDKWGLLGEAAKERQKIAEDEIALTQKQRENLVANAEAERDIAELRARAADKQKYTAEERLGFLRQAADKEEEIARRAMEAARMEYEIQKARAQLTQNSTEQNDKLAQSYAALIQAETAYHNKQRELQGQINGVLNEERRVRKAAADEAKRKAQEAERQAREAAQAEQAALSAEKDLLAQEAALLAAGSEERLALEKAAREKEYQAAVAAAKQKIKDQQQLDRTLTVLKKNFDQDIEKLDRDHANALIDNETEAYRNRVAVATEGTKEYLAAVADLRKRELETIRKQDGETEEAYQGRVIAARKAVAEALKAVDDAAAEENRLRLENDMNALEEGSLERLDAAVALKQHELDTLHQLEGESNEAFRARELAAQKEHDDAVKASFEGRVNLVQTYAGAVTSLLGALADAYEANSEANEKAAREAKALRIASAVIDTLSGAVGAYMGAVKSVPGVAGIVLGAINAAAVTATGVAQIAKIKATDVSRKSTGSTAVASVQAVTPTASVQAPSTSVVQSSRQVSGASENTQLNNRRQDIRVVMVQSDLEAALHDAATVEMESSF